MLVHLNENWKKIAIAVDRFGAEADKKAFNEAMDIKGKFGGGPLTGPSHGKYKGGLFGN
jgi:hypothetical protein